MELELSGKKALITGASRGIGKAIAEVLHREGCQVVLNGRNAESLDLLVGSLTNSSVVLGDVTQPIEAKRVVEEATTRLGQLDILICNVGGGRSVAPGDETYDEWQRIFALNLWSATNIVEAAREILALSKGVIVCISSICGLEVVPNAPITYSAAKAALHAYVHGIARPLGQLGVRINAVAPGNILFENSVWAKKLHEDANAVQEILNRDVALRKLGKPIDVAELVAYLASSRANFATGGIWTLDGGQVRG